MRIQDSDDEEPYIAEDSDEEERMLQTAIEVSPLTLIWNPGGVASS